MEEIWRDIKGYEGLYKISSIGRVKSLRNSHGNYREMCLKCRKNKKGYLNVSLNKDKKRFTYLVHRLVAEAFIENPNNYKEVNHKDENKQNNKVNNLEWCDCEYNNNYGTRNKRHSESIKGSKHPQARKVYCVTTGKKFNCIKEAAEYYHIDRHSIGDCCRKQYKYAGKHPVTGENLVWKYLDVRGNK